MTIPQIFDFIVSVLAFIGGFYALREILPAKVSLFIADSVSFPLSEGEHISRFYLGCNFVNERARLGTVHRIEVKVTSPKKHVRTFIWNSFCGYANSDTGIQRESNPYPIAVIPKNNQNLFIEFESIESIAREQWEVGRYEFEVMGWMNKGRRVLTLNRKHNVRSKFHINITESIHSELMTVHEVVTIAEAELWTAQSRHTTGIRGDLGGGIGMLYQPISPIYLSVPVEEWKSSPLHI